MKVYFDNAATTPLRNEVIELMTQSMTTLWEPLLFMVWQICKSDYGAARQSRKY